MQRHGDRSLGRGRSFFLKGVGGTRTRSKTICLSEESGHHNLVREKQHGTVTSPNLVLKVLDVLQTPDALGLNSSFAMYHLYAQISHLIFVTYTTDQSDLAELFSGLNEIRCTALNSI